jgi:hypothetical protein
VEKTKLYSTNQVGAASFVGGPFGVVYVLWRNFEALGRSSSATQALVLGGLFVAVVFAVLPLLPEKFPNYVIPLAYSLTARVLAEKYQMSKQAIADSEQYEFHSNWHVFGISVAFLIAFMAIAVLWVFGLDHLGLIKL